MQGRRSGYPDFLPSFTKKERKNTKHRSVSQPTFQRKLPESALSCHFTHRPKEKKNPKPSDVTTKTCTAPKKNDLTVHNHPTERSVDKVTGEFAYLNTPRLLKRFPHLQWHWAQAKLIVICIGLCGFFFPLLSWGGETGWSSRAKTCTNMLVSLPAPARKEKASGAH